MASGDQLAPLGTALPAPKDIKEVKKLNNENQNMMKSMKGNSSTLGRTKKESNSNQRRSEMTPKNTTAVGLGDTMKDDIMGLHSSNLKTPLCSYSRISWTMITFTSLFRAVSSC